MAPLAQAWYFLSGAAGTFLFPFLHLFLAGRGLSSAQIGMLAAARPWISAPVSLVSTAFADTRRAHRPMLLWSLVVSTALRASLPFVHGAAALAALLLASEAVGAPVGVIADSTILSNLTKEGEYGALRTFASAGVVMCSLLAGSLISALGVNSAFAAYFLLSIPLAWVAWRLQYRYPPAPGAGDSRGPAATPAGSPWQQHRQQRQDQRPRQQQQRQQQQQLDAKSPQHTGLRQRRRRMSASSDDADAASDGSTPLDAPDTPGAGERTISSNGTEETPALLGLLSSPQAVLFLVRCLLMGFGVGLIATFEFLYMKELGAPEVLMGVALTVTCCAEVPAFALQGAILQRVPIPLVFDAALLALAVRLACYSLLPCLPSMWLILPVELLQGVTFAAGWGAATLYATRLAPPQMASTMQGVFQATYLGLGGGLGGLVGGLVMERHGGGALFRWSSVAVLAAWAAAHLVERWWCGGAAATGGRRAPAA